MNWIEKLDIQQAIISNVELWLENNLTLSFNSFSYEFKRQVYFY